MKQLKQMKLTAEDFRKVVSTQAEPCAQIFDNVLIVTSPGTNAIVLNTSEGLILIDAIMPGVECYNNIVNSIKQVGWDPAQIKMFIITHGHPDHTGCGKLIIEEFHPKTYMSKIDYAFWYEHPALEQFPADFVVENFIVDGDVLKLGDMEIHVISTPGHTPGGLSFIFPVKDIGDVHWAAMWGGTNPPPDIKAVVTYMQSLDRFLSITDKFGVDVAIGNHPIIDNGLERMEVARVRYSHMPNPFIIGRKGYIRYTQLFRDMCYDRLSEM